MARLERTRVRVEDLHAKSLLNSRDLDVVYEGLFLECVTAFETFLETLFFATVMGQLDFPVRRVKSRIEVRSSQVLRVIVKGDRQFVDWLPYEHTERRAKMYLRQGRPFSDLTDAQTSLIQRVVWTRNAIAHQSREARQKFDRNVLGSTPLLPRERSPAGFLRSQPRGPGSTQFQLMTNELIRICWDLTN